MTKQKRGAHPINQKYCDRHQLSTLYFVLNYLYYTLYLNRINLLCVSDTFTNWYPIEIGMRFFPRLSIKWKVWKFTAFYFILHRWLFLENWIHSKFTWIQSNDFFTVCTFNFSIIGHDVFLLICIFSSLAIKFRDNFDFSNLKIEIVWIHTHTHRERNWDRLIS